MSARPVSSSPGLLEQGARLLARRTSRRGFLGRLGGVLVGGMILPVLPLDRRGSGAAAAADFGSRAQAHDDTQCNYWRYCAIGGNLCSCCGGTNSSCPAGTFAPLTGWVGSCLNPEDKKTYLVRYSDCCGKAICGRCSCLSSEHALPSYRAQSTDEFLWCFGTNQMAYHCTLSTVIGEA